MLRFALAGVIAVASFTSAAGCTIAAPEKSRTRVGACS